MEGSNLKRSSVFSYPLNESGNFFDLIIQHLDLQDVKNIFQVSKAWNKAAGTSRIAMDKLTLSMYNSSQTELLKTTRMYTKVHLKAKWCGEFGFLKMCFKFPPSGFPSEGMDRIELFAKMKYNAIIEGRLDVVSNLRMRCHIDRRPTFELYWGEVLSKSLWDLELLPIFNHISSENLHTLRLNEVCIDSMFVSVLGTNKNLKVLEIICCAITANKRNIGDKLRWSLESLRFKKSFFKNSGDEFVQAIILSQKKTLKSINYDSICDGRDLFSCLFKLKVLEKLTLKRCLPIGKCKPILSLKYLNVALWRYDDFISKLGPNVQTIFVCELTEEVKYSYKNSLPHLELIHIGSDYLPHKYKFQIKISAIEKDPLLQLNDKSCSLLFQHLTSSDVKRATNVSKAWATIIGNSSICMQKIQPVISKDTSRFFIGSFRNYQNLKFKLPPYDCEKFYENFKNVTNIEFVDCEVEDKPFLSYLRALETLSYIGTEIKRNPFRTHEDYIYVRDQLLKNVVLSGISCKTIFQNLQNYTTTSLVIRNVIKSTQDIEDPIDNPNKFVKMLDITTSGLLSDVQIRLIKMCPNLERLLIKFLSKDLMKEIRRNNKKIVSICYHQTAIDHVTGVTLEKLVCKTLDPLVRISEDLFPLIFQHFKSREARANQLWLNSTIEKTIEISTISKTWFKTTEKSEEFLRHQKLTNFPNPKSLIDCADAIKSKRRYQTLQIGILNTDINKAASMKLLEDLRKHLVNLNITIVNSINLIKFTLNPMEFPNLKHLELSSHLSEKTPPSELTEVLRTFICTNLVQVYFINFLTKVDDLIVIEDFLVRNSKLKKFYCDGVDEMYKLFLSKNFTNRVKFKLNYLRFSIPDVTGFRLSEELNDNFTDFLSTQAETLEEIDLMRVTSKMVNVIFSKAKTLREFRFTLIKDNHAINPEIFTTLKSLRLLELPFSFNLGHFKHYLASAPNLETLLVFGLSSEILEYAHEYLKKLKNIFYDTHSLGDSSINFIYMGIQVWKTEMSDLSERTMKIIAERKGEFYQRNDTPERSCFMSQFLSQLHTIDLSGSELVSSYL